MNQILLTDDNNDKKGSSKKNNDNYRSNSKDIKKIVIFFAAVIIVFGIALSSIYGYKVSKRNKNDEKVIKEPTISLESTESEVTVIAEAEAGLNKIIYQWNDEEENESDMNGRTKQEEKLEIPYGENILKIKIVDRAGQEKFTTEKFYRKNSLNIELDGEETDSGKARIKVTSDIDIKYISYKWDDQEETKVEPRNEEEQTSMEIKLDVQRGKHTLKVFVEDNQGNTNEKEKNYICKIKPKIEFRREGNRIYMKITHDKGFKKIDFKINDIELTYDETKADYAFDKPEVEYYIDLTTEETKISIKAYSNEDTEESNEKDFKLENATP